MLKLMIGVKGTGKTKTLIQMVHNALDQSNGAVVCLEKGKKLTFDIKYQCRLIDTEEYRVNTTDALFGMVAGILASNHDVTDLFIDSALKICNNDTFAFDQFVEKVHALAEKLNMNIVMTSSIPVEEASETVKKYI